MHYTKEFKEKAVSLSIKMGSKVVAKRLGISHSLLQSWIDSYYEDSCMIIANSPSSEIENITQSVNFLSSLIGFN